MIKALDKFCWILILLFSLTGCETLGSFNPATGRHELIFVSTPTEIQMGNSIDQQLSASEKMSQDGQLVRRIERIGQRLAQVSDRQDYAYNFKVIEKDEINAFTVPGGRIYIYTGLIKRIKSDDAIAAVLAHEIGHCSARHAIKKFQAALGFQLVSGLVLGQIEEEQAQKVAALGSGAIMTIASSAYGRQDEYEADRLGLKYMVAAGYDPRAMVQMFEVLEQEEGRSGGVPLILRSHPYASDRIIAIQKEIEKIGR